MIGAAPTGEQIVLLNGIEASDRGAVPLAPWSVSEFRVETRIERPGVHLDIRSYSFVSASESVIQPPAAAFDLVIEHSGQRISGCDYDQAPHFQPRGEVVFMPPGRSMRIRTAASRQRSLCCAFDVAALADQMEYDLDGDLFALSFDLRCREVRSDLRRLYSEIVAPGFGSALAVDALVAMLFIHLVRHFQPRPDSHRARRGGLSARQLRLIEDRCRSNPGDAPNLAELADLCAISVRHLTRAFKSVTGMTLSQYFAETRLEYAKRLLNRPGYLIKQIAFDCGYCSQSAFSTAFSNATGVTPGEYRRDRTVYGTRWAH